MHFKTVHIKFREFKRRVGKTCKCRECGKTLRRTTTLRETENPWNLNETGSPKSPKEIYESLGHQAELWKRESEVCKACEEAS